MYIQLNPSDNLEELTDDFLSSTLAKKELPFRFYSKIEIKTSVFRAVYYEPTLEKLDNDVLREILSFK